MDRRPWSVRSFASVSCGHPVWSFLLEWELKLTPEERLKRKREANSRWAKANRKHLNTYKREHPPQYERWRKLEQRYGLTKEQFEKKLASQGGGCAICGESIKKLDVDHNHLTNITRGILCRSCNVGLGLFKESKDLLVAVIQYLHFWSGQ